MNIGIDDLYELEDGDVLEKLWAKRKIEELGRYLDTGNPRRAENIKSDIVKISENYGVISSQTSFVAVYERKNKLSGLPETVVVPVCEPHGWDMFEPDYSGSMPFVGKGSVRLNSIVGASAFSRVSNHVEEPHMEFMTQETDAFYEYSPMASMPVSHKASPPRAKSTESKDDIKALASRQNFNGSFGKASADAAVNVRETAKALIAFASSSSDITPFRGQLKKAVEYIMAAEDKIVNDPSLVKLVYAALELCRMRKAVRDSSLADVEKFVEKLKLNFKRPGDIEKVDKMIGENDIKGLKKLM